jgi:hypothetical protein
MSKYEVIETEISTSISRTDDNGQVWWIPADPANADYQRYLAWVENPEAEQSTPIVKDETKTK